MDASGVAAVLSIAVGAGVVGIKLYIEAANGMIGCSRKARDHLIEAHGEVTGLRRTIRKGMEDADGDDAGEDGSKE